MVNGAMTAMGRGDAGGGDEGAGDGEGGNDGDCDGTVVDRRPREQYRSPVKVVYACSILGRYHRHSCRTLELILSR